MTAEDGADRVAERRIHNGVRPSIPERDLEPVEDDELATPMFSCEQCGGHEFIFSRTWDSQQVLQRRLPCACGQADFAIEQKVLVTTQHVRIGRLGADHRVAWKEGEEEFDGACTDEETDREVEEEEIGCERCARATDGEFEIVEEVDTQDVDEHCELHCASCDHEIEFGYSHAEGGRVWPVESVDFIPWRTFPVERFREAWAQRGWLKPARPNRA
jgi:hypothetical protein